MGVQVQAEHSNILSPFHHVLMPSGVVMVIYISLLTVKSKNYFHISGIGFPFLYTWLWHKDFGIVTFQDRPRQLHWPNVVSPGPSVKVNWLDAWSCDNGSLLLDFASSEMSCLFLIWVRWWIQIYSFPPKELGSLRQNLLSTSSKHQENGSLYFVCSPLVMGLK